MTGSSVLLMENSPKLVVTLERQQKNGGIQTQKEKGAVFPGGITVLGQASWDSKNLRDPWTCHLYCL